MTNRTEISIHRQPSPADAPVEVVERKGLGPPDTLADALAERMSVAYSRYCLQNFVAVLHHNLDKLYLRGGHCRTGTGAVDSRVTRSLPPQISHQPKSTIVVNHSEHPFGCGSVGMRADRAAPPDRRIAPGWSVWTVALGGARRGPYPLVVPHFHRSFENPPALPHGEVAGILDRALDDRSDEPAAADALIGIALGDEDREFIERCCLKIGTRASAGSPLLGLAGLCLGHAARRFRYLSDEAIALARVLAARAEQDPSDVDGRALDGMGDIRSFLPGDRTGPLPSRSAASGPPGPPEVLHRAEAADEITRPG